MQRFNQLTLKSSKDGSARVAKDPQGSK